MQRLSLDWVPGQEEATRDATRHLGQLRTRTARKITAVGDHSLLLALVRSHTRTSRSQEVHTEVFRNKRAQCLQLTLKKRVCAHAHTRTQVRTVRTHTHTHTRSSEARCQEPLSGRAQAPQQDEMSLTVPLPWDHSAPVAKSPEVPNGLLLARAVPARSRERSLEGPRWPAWCGVKS